MAYPVNGGLVLGASNSGLTLVAALFDTTGAAVGGLVTTNIHEVAAGSGSYSYDLTVPDNHRGYVKFTSAGTFKSVVFINPDETVNPFQRNLIADHVLCREWSAITLPEGTRTAWQALRFLRNAWEIVAGILSVKKENGVTEAWNKTVTTDALAEPITEVSN